MYIPVILKDGKERSVSKDELQFLMVTKQVILFMRSDGWAILGRDKMRLQRAPYYGEERRQHEVFAQDY